MKKHSATFFAILAAALYAINVPLSKLLLPHVGSVMMAGFLYLGAGIGMLLYVWARKLCGHTVIREKLTKSDLPYTLGMIVLDIAAPILLMLGIERTNSANVSLLNNFEIVATSLIALIIFKEIISKKLWFCILLVTVASGILSFESMEAFTFNLGSLLVLGACVCWGFENNCTRMISSKSSEEIVILKGICSGSGSVIVALLVGERFPHIGWILAVLLLGFVAYGLSINFYIMAQKDLGAAKTSAYYSVAPFLGVAFSLLLLGERPSFNFYIALVIMLISTVMMAHDTVKLQHNHEHTHVHTHMHRHGNLVHCHPHTHVHTHLHAHEEGGEMHEHDLSDDEEHEMHHEHLEIHNETK